MEKLFFQFTCVLYMCQLKYQGISISQKWYQSTLVERGLNWKVKLSINQSVFSPRVKFWVVTERIKAAEVLRCNVKYLKIPRGL